MSRRTRVWAALLSLSVLFVLGAWSWNEASMRAQVAEGADPLTVTLHANGYALQATYGWVVVAVLVHGLLAAIGWRRGDREVVQGVGASAAGHLLLWVALGVLGG